MSAPMPTPRIFISYAHADRAWLRSLVTHLRGALGSNDPDFIFFDENSLRSGDTWSERLRQEVVARPIFIVALTPNSLASEFVRDEVEMALRETAAHPQRRFISLMVQPCDPARLSPKLLDYQITDFTQQPFNIAFAVLLGAIRPLMSAWGARPPQPPQGYPQPGYPPQGPQGYPQPQPGYPPQGYPQPQRPAYPQPQPPQGYPPQPAYPQPQPQSFPPQGYPPQGYPQPQQPQSYPPVYQPAPQAPTMPPTQPPSVSMPSAAPTAASAAAAPSASYGAPPAIAPAPVAPVAPVAPPTPAAAPSAQALQMAKDVHSYFIDQNWVEVVRRGEFAMTLPDNASDGRLPAEVAVALAEQKRWDKAGEAIEHAMLLTPWRADLWQEKARMQLAFGQVDEALVSYDWAFGLAIADYATRKPVRQAIFTERRKLLMDGQQWDEALANVEAELGESANDLDLLRIRAELLLKLGLRDEAARPFLQRRLTSWMRRLGYDLRTVRGVELVDAPLCAVPAGEFLFGSNSDTDQYADGYEEPQMPIKTVAYAIGRYPVTVAEYDRFVRSGGTPPTEFTFSGTLYNWDKLLEHPDYPVVNLSWRQAVAYARWLAEITGEPWRLPTEPEWEKAARWDAEQGRPRIYPWGDTYDITCLDCSDNLGGVTRVGTFPRGASPYGLLDMAGNVTNYCSSLYRRYPYSTKDGREDLDAPGGRIARGAGYGAGFKMQRSAARQSFSQDDVSRYGGFRLVRGEASYGVQAPMGGVIASSGLSSAPGGIVGPNGVVETERAAGMAAPASPGLALASEAHFAFLSGRWDEAASKGEQALAQPDVTSAPPTAQATMIETAQAYAALQRWPESGAWASRALAADAFNAELWLALARAQRGQGQTNDAVLSYNHGLAVVAPDKRTLRLTLLTEQRGLLMEQMRWPEALGVLDEELRLSPDQERQNLRTEILRQLG